MLNYTYFIIFVTQKKIKHTGFQPMKNALIFIMRNIPLPGEISDSILNKGQ